MVAADVIAGSFFVTELTAKRATHPVALFFGRSGRQWVLVPIAAPEGLDAGWSLS
jgi:hypothetical protein